MREIQLRDYQVASIEGLRQGIRDGHRAQILCAPTGAGKTVCAAYLMREAKAKGSRVAFLVDRVALVDQTSASLDHYGIDHGVQQAGHWRRRGYEPIQVCSAQTIEKRGFFPDLQLLIVDECHAMRAATIELIKARQDIRVIGLTATPFTKGLGAVYSNVVNVTTTNRLVQDGFLVPLKMYAARAVDMTGARVVAGEWSEKEIEERGNAIVGDIVCEWVDKTRLHFGGPAKTIVFAATVEHGEELCRQFNAAGFNFQQISYKDTNDERRRELIAEFRKSSSSIDGLVSCEIFSKGFDVTDVMVGISARPYRKSLSSHIQQLGRVMRPHEGKSFGLWLDHSGNVLRFKDETDDIFENGAGGLDDGQRDAKARSEPSEKARETIRCGGCGFILPTYAKVCPACGKERASRSLVETIPGVMVEIGGKKVEASGKYEFLNDRERVWREVCAIALDRKHGDIEAAQKFAQAQYRSIYGDFARRRVEGTEPLAPSTQVANLIRHNIIRWAKSRARSAAHA